MSGRLFERHTQGVELTPKGTAFLKKVLRLLEAADVMLAEDASPMRGLLRLGSNESAALAGLAAFLQTMHERYPTLQYRRTRVHCET